jgi:hypothetical protein
VARNLPRLEDVRAAAPADRHAAPKHARAIEKPVRHDRRRKRVKERADERSALPLMQQ